LKKEKNQTVKSGNSMTLKQSIRALRKHRELIQKMKREELCLSAEVGAIIKSLRKERRIKACAVAERLKINQGGLSQIEHGALNISEAILKKLEAL